jgi:hypothetical protein
VSEKYCDEAAFDSARSLWYDELTGADAWTLSRAASVFLFVPLVFVHRSVEGIEEGSAHAHARR